MAIVRTTTTAGGDLPEKKQTSGKSVVRQPAARAGMPGRSQIAVKQGNAGSFVKDTQTELRRVVWPTNDEVRSGAIVTIGLLIFFALYIYGLDVIAQLAFNWLGLYPPTPNG